MLLSKQITEHINKYLKPLHCELINESHLHHTNGATETHFKLIVVSAGFESKSRIQRHQSVYQCLDSFFQNSSLHALSMHLFSPSEWQTKQEGIIPSPSCRGGFNAG